MSFDKDRRFPITNKFSIYMQICTESYWKLHMEINARVALLNYLLRKNKKLDFLRIDDTDKERSDEKFVESIVDDLSWLGISFSKIIRQSNRLSIYEDIFNELKKRINLSMF